MDLVLLALAIFIFMTLVGRFMNRSSRQDPHPDSDVHGTSVADDSTVSPEDESSDGDDAGSALR